VAPPPARAASPALAVKPLADGVDRMDWAALQQTAAACEACGLCAQRKNSVFGVGDVQADWLVVGEAPSEEDDLAGEPFAGQAGQLLDNMLKAVGLSRKAQVEGGVYIANVTKCRTPGTQNPSPEELATCAPYLARQVALVQPKIILLMGRFAVQSVLQSTEPLGKLRGQVHTHQGVPVVVTYHPSYLLRNPADKAKAWADLVLALKTAQS
jgi:DNA polymerase